jgi:hypothetical protein
MHTHLWVRGGCWLSGGGKGFSTITAGSVIREAFAGSGGEP